MVKGLRDLKELPLEDRTGQLYKVSSVPINNSE